MKKLMQLVLMLIFLYPLLATTLSENEIKYAIDTVKDASFVASNYFISSIKPDNPSLILRTPKNSGISDAIVFENCDMSSLLSFFPSVELDSHNMIKNLKEPLSPFVRDSLIKNNWKENESVINGAIAIAFKDDYSISQIVSNLIDGIYPRMGLVTDITISGLLYSEKINIKGVFILEGDDDSLDIIPLQITLNGDDFDFYSL